MKKTIRILYIVFSVVALGMIIFGVARLAMAEDVIGSVPLATSSTEAAEEFTGVPIIIETGDFNGDGQVNSDDAIRLLMYTQFNESHPGEYPLHKDAGTADLNNDKEVNSDDAIYMLMYTQFPENYPIEPTAAYD